MVDQGEGHVGGKMQNTPATAKSDPKSQPTIAREGEKNAFAQDKTEIISPSSIALESTLERKDNDEDHAHLVEYSQEKNRERLRRRIARRSSIRQPFQELEVSAAEASRAGDMQALEMWLQTHDINAIDVSNFGHKRTALHKAAAHGHTPMVQMLLERGANPDCFDSLGRTPLFWAARHGHARILQNLLDFGCEYDVKDVFGKNALDLAKEEEESECVAIIERFIRSHSRLVCMRVLGCLTNDPRLRAIWKWKIWMAEQNDNEAASRALDAAAKAHMLKQKFELQQTKAIEELKRLHEKEVLDLRQQLEDALLLVKQLSKNSQNSEDSVELQKGSEDGKDLKAKPITGENVIRDT